MSISKTIIKTLHDIYSSETSFDLAIPDNTSFDLAIPAVVIGSSHFQIEKLTCHGESIIEYGESIIEYVCIHICPENGSGPQDYIKVGITPFLQKLDKNSELLNKEGLTVGDVIEKINAQLKIDEATTLSSAPRM